MADLVPVVGASSHGYQPIVLSEWVKADMAQQRICLYDPDKHGWEAWTGYYCTGSGCIEDRTDSHMQCINCGEALLHVTSTGETVHG